MSWEFGLHFPSDVIILPGSSCMKTEQKERERELIISSAPFLVPDYKRWLIRSTEKKMRNIYLTYYAFVFSFDLVHSWTTLFSN